MADWLRVFVVLTHLTLANVEGTSVLQGGTVRKRLVCRSRI